LETSKVVSPLALKRLLHTFNYLHRPTYGFHSSTVRWALLSISI